MQMLHGVAVGTFWLIFFSTLLGGLCMMGWTRLLRLFGRQQAADGPSPFVRFWDKWILQRLGVATLVIGVVAGIISPEKHGPSAGDSCGDGYKWGHVGPPGAQDLSCEWVGPGAEPEHLRSDR